VKRRELCLGAATSALGIADVAYAQRKRTARLGVLTDIARGDPVLDGMFTRLAELGWSEMRNLAIEYHVIGTDAAANTAMVRAVVHAKCDLIFTHHTPIALAVKAMAPSTPMVFGIGGDPVALGLVASLGRPGGNATGWTSASPESAVKLMALLRELVPQAQVFAVMFEADHASSLQGLELMKAGFASVGFTLRAFPLRDWKDVDAAELTLMREPVDGLAVLFDHVTSANRVNIVAVASRRRLPAVYGSRYFVDDGGLLSYGINWPAQIRRAAEYIARILHGAKPADLPVERPTEFELLVNLHTARVMGSSVPQSVLLPATEEIR
jgi:putative ABC transport system substrate-binding protein